MYTRYLDVAARHGFCPLMGGLDYWASQDWAAVLGYSPDALAEMQLRSIDFLRDVAKPYVEQVPAIYFVGIVGPRGDAYTADRAITADEAEDHQGEQRSTRACRRRSGGSHDLHNIPEAVGLAVAHSEACVGRTAYSPEGPSHGTRQGAVL